MTRSLKVYQGEDLTPVTDLSEPSSNVHVIWEEIEAGHRAYQLESSVSTFPMRDERGQTGNSASLPSGLTPVSLAAHNRIVWTEGSNTMFRGRIGPKDYSRGRQKADRAREVVVSAEDINYDLRGIIVDGWTRPEETDVARIQALLTDYLSGSPRGTTDISNTYLATGSNTVTLPALRYDSTNPAEILGGVASIASKLAFVTVDSELFYDGYDSTAYQAGIRISDRIDEIDTSIEGCETGAASFEGGGGKSDSSTSVAIPLTVGSGANRCLWAALLVDVNHTVDASWKPGFLNEGFPGTGQNMTLVDTQIINGNHGLKLYRLVDPDVSTEPTSAVFFSTSGTWKAIGAWLAYGVDQTTPEASVVKNSGTGSSSSITVASGDLIFDAAAWSDSTGTPVTMTATGDQNQVFAVTLERTPGFQDYSFAGGQGADLTPSWSFGASHPWGAMAWAVNPSDGSGEDSGLATFPPIWDVGPSSTEDGMELLSGLRLYYGPDADQYVYVSDPTTANQYAHYEESLFTSDPAITTASAATTLAQAILQRRKFEERTYNVSIGPLNDDQVGCLKPGQLINIKARAIPDADDNFVTRRIAQLRWTTPVPGTFFAHMQLNRPMKEAGYGVGNRAGSQAIGQHVLQGSNSHPEFVPRALLTAQGDLPYRGASDWTRLGIGGSNTWLKSIGTAPVWANLPSLPATVTVEEEDGTPSVAADTIKFPNGTVTDNADGSVSVTTSGASVPAPLHLMPTKGAGHGGYNTVGTANRGVFLPVLVPAACIVTGIRLLVGTSSGNIDVGLYDSAGNLVASSGSVACPASGIASVAFSASYAASAGSYFLALSANNNTATFSRSGTPGTFVPGEVWLRNSSFPLPSSVTISSTESGASAFNMIGLVSGGWP